MSAISRKGCFDVSVMGAMSTRKEVFKAIDSERAYQDRLWPQRVTGHSHPLCEAGAGLLTELLMNSRRSANR
jgi:hypothetical protein